MRQHPHVGPPVARRRGGQIDLGEDLIEHQVHEAVAAAHVLAERHRRRGAERRGDPAHRDGPLALGIGDLDRRPGDVGATERGPPRARGSGGSHTSGPGERPLKLHVKPARAAHDAARQRRHRAQPNVARPRTSQREGLQRRHRLLHPGLPHPGLPHHLDQPPTRRPPQIIHRHDHIGQVVDRQPGQGRQPPRPEPDTDQRNAPRGREHETAGQRPDHEAMSDPTPLAPAQPIPVSRVEQQLRLPIRPHALPGHGRLPIVPLHRPEARDQRPKPGTRRQLGVARHVASHDRIARLDS
jgi:hypothetical protein